jgi:hypothetical protein
MNEQKIIFVYNANSDLFSTVSDFAHKILSPSTYRCQLCALTYDSFSMKQEWKSFVQKLPVKTIFLHKDEFEKQYSMQSALPAVFASSGGAIKEMITTQEIEECPSIEKLKNLVSEKVNDYVQHHHSDL